MSPAGTVRRHGMIDGVRRALCRTTAVIRYASDTAPPAISAPPDEELEATIPTGVVYTVRPHAGVARGIAPLAISLTVDGSMWAKQI
jgi:hypothetical protein